MVSNESEKLYQILVDHLLQGISILLDGRVVFANTASVGILGYSVEEQLTMPPEKVRALVHPEDHSTAWRRYQDRIEKKTAQPSNIYHIIRKDCESRWIRSYSSPIDYRNRVVPFAGRWYVNPAPIDLLAIPNRLLEDDDPEPAFAYLRRHIGTPRQPMADVPSSWFYLFREALAGCYHDVGIGLASRQQHSQGAEALNIALKIAPNRWDTLAALASLYDQRREPRQMLAIFEQMLRLRPRDMSVANNVAWMLATSPDDSVRDPQRALQLAQAVCRATGNRIPTTLDTLAAAYAALGQFAEAERTVAQALQLPGQTPDAKLKLQRRLEAYQRGEAYRDPRSNAPSGN